MSSLVHYIRRADEAFHDWRLGISASEWHAASHPERRGYEPTAHCDWRIIRRHISPKGTFIDYGAGLGRVAILAALMPFDDVIGVEFDPVLADRGQNSINRAHSRARIQCIDARDFDIPANTSTLYFCNPFAGSILTAVLDRARQVPAMIVCNLPPVSAFENEITHVPWLRLAKTFPLHQGRKCLFLARRNA